MPENALEHSELLTRIASTLAPLQSLVPASPAAPAASDPSAKLDINGPAHLVEGHTASPPCPSTLAATWPGLLTDTQMLVAKLMHAFSSDMLHMDCELRLATTAQARESAAAALASLQAEQSAAARAQQQEREALQHELDRRQRALDALRARMLVDAQDTAAVEEQLQAAQAREAASQAAMMQLRGELTVGLAPVMWN